MQPFETLDPGRPAVVAGMAREASAGPAHGSDAILRRFARFVTLTGADRRRLLHLAGTATPQAARRTVLTEARPCDCLHMLVAGWAMETRTLPTGERQVLRIRLPGEVFGAECLAYGQALQSVQMLTGGLIARIPRNAVADLRVRHPQVVTGLALMGLYERAVLQEWIIGLGRRPAWPRIAHLLLEIDERCRLSGLARPAGTPFPLKQRDLADCTGLTLTTVNRVLADMRRRRLIGLRAQALAIPGRDDLARACGFQPRYLRPDLAVAPGPAPKHIASVG